MKRNFRWKLILAVVIIDLHQLTIQQNICKRQHFSHGKKKFLSEFASKDFFSVDKLGSDRPIHLHSRNQPEKVKTSAKDPRFA